VVEGAPGLSPMGRSEQTSLVYERGESVLRTRTRLACQARLHGETTVTVRKAGVRPPLEAGARGP
jgi:ferredoxin